MDGPEVIEENQLRELQDFRYYSPKFEADEYNPGLLRYLPWAGHRAFAYDYVRNERPSCIVELGSYYGCSAFAFLQAMKDGGIAGSFYAVDTWEGDSFTKNDYREDIYGQYKEIQDTCFSGWNSSFEKDSSGKDLHKRDTISDKDLHKGDTVSDKDLHKGDTTSDKGAHMLRMTFDEAVRLFEDDSIDLLHIDGSHLYEDVKHDFLTWKNKVKKDGVIFFHDISDEEVFGEVMGSHVFWKELVSQYPLTLEFPFSLGLGVLCFDEKKYQKLRENISIDHYQMLANHADDQNREVIRENFFKIRDLTEYRDSLISQVELLNTEIARYGETVRGKEAYIAELQQDTETLNAALGEKDKYIGELQGDLKKYASTVAGKDAYIDSLEERIERLVKSPGKLEERVRELEGQKSDLEEAVSQYEKNSKEQTAYIEELESGLAGYREDAGTREQYIHELLGAIGEFTEDAEKKDRYISELRVGIEGYQTDLALKDHYIAELENGLQEYAKDTAVKNLFIEDLQVGLENYKKDTDAKERYIGELRSAIAEYEKNTAGKDAYIAELLDRCDSLSREAESAVLLKNEAKKEVLRYREELSKSLFGRGLLKRMGKSDE